MSERPAFLRALARALAGPKRALRSRSEYALRLAAMRRLARRYPQRATRSALPEPGRMWSWVFVPLYRSVPWQARRRAMRALRMTARGWPEAPRRFREPWRPAGSGAQAPQRTEADRAPDEG